jgi:hypothetical protein
LLIKIDCFKPRPAAEYLVLDGPGACCHSITIPFAPKPVPVPRLPVLDTQITGFRNIVLKFPFRNEAEEWEEYGVRHRAVGQQMLTLAVGSIFHFSFNLLYYATY